MNHDRIAYCGVDCSVCKDYQNKICPGCRATIWTDDTICNAVKCCREKKIESCGQCMGFPCEMMKEFYEESESHKAAYQRMAALHEELFRSRSTES